MAASTSGVLTARGAHAQSAGRSSRSTAILYCWQRRWRPTLPTTSGCVTGDRRLIDFLTLAGVDPTSRKQ
jgi:hypothetical protein